ncbi:phosphosulfolactate phosphohydrolase [Microbacterium sp. ZW T5_45]|uniref:phosphosulfolactate phosphohydrolase n=1 Tax=Microbacterium sp. ZW T5_45 TaxID=3378080 RepID=UPI003852AC47
MPSPFDQSTYQVRLDWGVDGLARLAPADIVIVVDVLRFSSTVADEVARGREVGLADALAWSRNGAAVADAASEALVLLGGIRNAAAVARAVQTVQERRRARTSVAVIAAGEADAAGVVRLATEDQLGAGAIVAALTDLGIDHTAPEAAVAAEGFRALSPGAASPGGGDRLGPRARRGGGIHRAHGGRGCRADLRRGRRRSGCR